MVDEVNVDQVRAEISGATAEFDHWALSYATAMDQLKQRRARTTQEARIAVDELKQRQNMLKTKVLELQQRTSLLFLPSFRGGLSPFITLSLLCPQPFQDALYVCTWVFAVIM